MNPVSRRGARFVSVLGLLVAGCVGGNTDSASGSTSAASAATSKPSAPPLDAARMKKLLADPTKEQREELVKVGPPGIPLIKKRIQEFVLESYRAPKDKKWDSVVNATGLVEVLGKIGKPAVPALNDLCADFLSMRKLGKDYDIMYRTMRPKICPIVESHGEVCRCKT